MNAGDYVVRVNKPLLLLPLSFHFHILFLVLGHRDERGHCHSIQLTESLRKIVSTKFNWDFRD